MPIIRVSCLPKMPKKELRRLYQSIMQAALEITELGLTGEKDITCLFPPDMMKYGLGSEVIVEVFGLFEKRERTPDVIDRLARNLGTAVVGFFPNAKVECLIYPFNPKKRFWTNAIAA
jgi:hypothetical protein